MHHRTPPRSAAALTVVAAIVQLMFAGAADATAFERSTPPPVPAIVVTEQGLAPNDAVTGSGHAFTLESGIATPIAVAFELEPGQRVACAAPGRTPRLGRIFALSPGATLVCHAMPGRYRFTANHPLQLDSGAVARRLLSGWIEIS